MTRNPTRATCSALLLFVPALIATLVAPAYAITLTPIHALFELRAAFREPSDVAVSSDGTIYVVDGVNNSIKVFDQKGRLVSSWGRNGSGDGELQFPLGIDVDASGLVYVADTGNHRIQIFDSRGTSVGKVTMPSRNGKPPDPTDVAVDEPRNRLYVVDNDNHTILVYELSTRTFLQSFGEPGTEKRAFRYPFLMAVDHEGYLYVVDVINTRVQVLNREGLFVAYIGGWGVEKGEFYRPKGVALDKQGRVYVSDSYVGVIQVFKPNGEFCSVLGDGTKGAIMKFKTPTGIVIDRNNHLYVVEMFAEKVSVYAIGDDGEGGKTVNSQP